MLMGIIPNLGFLKLEGSGFMRLVLSTNCAVRHLLYPQCHIDLYHQRNTQNAAGQSSRGSASKGQMQLTSYLWKKNWNAMEKLWKSYGISFLGICTNPARARHFSSGGHGFDPGACSLLVGSVWVYTMTG